jgi:hypothetical protein
MDARSVFINCPFTPDYQKHFDAAVFAVIRSGFTPRCARESDDGGEVRFDKLCRIIADCRYGIHDISKTEPDPKSGLPRFNMPFELGLFLGAKKFASKHKTKRALILDKKPYRYQKFLSDIAGQDIHSHDGRAGTLIVKIASWLRDEVQAPNIPGGQKIAREYSAFVRDLPRMCATKNLTPKEITFKDFNALATAWIVEATAV